MVMGDTKHRHPDGRRVDDSKHCNGGRRMDDGSKQSDDGRRVDDSKHCNDGGRMDGSRDCNDRRVGKSKHDNGKCRVDESMLHHDMKACGHSSLALKRGDSDKPDGGAAGGGRMAMLAQWWGGYVGTVLGWLCWHSVQDMGVLVLERNPKSFISVCWFCSSASTC